ASPAQGDGHRYVVGELGDEADVTGMGHVPGEQVVAVAVAGLDQQGVRVEPAEQGGRLAGGALPGGHQGPAYQAVEDVDHHRGGHRLPGVERQQQVGGTAVACD